MNFREFLEEEIDEMTSFTRQQKDELCHVIINILTDPNAAKLLKRLENEAEDMLVTKTEVKAVLNNLKRIRDIIISLPVED